MKCVTLCKMIACLIIVQYISACGMAELADMALKKEKGDIDSHALNTIAMSLSEQLIAEGIDTVAVVDFTTSEGHVTPFEQAITEQMFVAMAGFSGKIWVMRGSDMAVVLENANSETEVWRVMGIKAVLYGRVTRADEDVTLSLRVINAATSSLISEREERCPLIIPATEKVTTSFNTDNVAKKTPDDGARSRGAESEEMDSLPNFPWPPVLASASTKIPSAFFVGENASVTLSQVAGTLEEALDNAGYIERSYYAAPKGFALVTRLEQVNPDGTPKSVPDRWSVQMTTPKVFSLASYLQALFTAQEGRFRIIAFIVTTAPFAQNPNVAISREDAMEWLSVGSQTLPASIGSLAYSERHYSMALIYEFEQPTRNHDATFKMLSALSGIEHLKQARIWEVLEQ